MSSCPYPIPNVIAEIGCSHLGSLERAKELCKLAKICGADYIKTQKRNPEESTPPHMRDKPHPNTAFAYGKTYLEHRQNLELSIVQHAELKAYCEDIGIGYSTSVWDMTSAREIVALNPDFIKIPSACNLHTEMLEFLRDNYEGDIHISTGMTTQEEMNKVLRFVVSDKIKSRVVVYHCTSKYPCEFDDLHILEIQKMHTMWKDSKIRVGYSNHGKGIATDIAAYTLGAEWIERHFIDDRTIRHTDAAASLEPPGLQKLCRDLHAVYRALQRRPKTLDDEEMSQRNKLKFSGGEYGQ